MGKRKREKHKPGSVGAEEAAGRGADPGFRPIGIGVYDAHRGGAFASAQIDHRHRGRAGGVHGTGGERRRPGPRRGVAADAAVDDRVAAGQQSLWGAA